MVKDSNILKFSKILLKLILFMLIYLYNKTERYIIYYFFEISSLKNLKNLDAKKDQF